MEQESLSIATLSWIPTWISNFQTKLGEAMTIMPDGALSVAEDADQTAYNHAASLFWTGRQRSQMVTRLTNRLLGELILNYKAKFHVTVAEAVEAMGIDTNDRALASMQKMVRIVERLSPETLSLPALGQDHFAVAVSFAGPSEPDKLREWNLKIADVLKEAAQSPDERPSKWVGEKIREMQKEFGIEPARNPGGKVQLDKYSQLCYILEHWTPDQFEESGHTREKVLDYRDHVENDLIERGILTVPEPKNFVPPFQTRSLEPVIDVALEDGGDVAQSELVLRDENEVDISLDDELPSLE